MYKEFCNGIFAVSKSENRFSSMTIDQAHKQNVFIKGVGGAARLLAQDRDGALWWLEIKGPKVVRLLNEYETFNHISPEIDLDKHHEDYPAFQKKNYSYK